MRSKTLMTGILAAGMANGISARGADTNATRSIGTQVAITPTIHLSGSATVQVSPDELVADLVATATSSSPAAAQRRVNTLIAGGMADARSVSAIHARAAGYAVEPADEKRTSWTAQQTLELRAEDGPALLDLAGKMQAEGFAMASLEWRLSEASRHWAHVKATTAALTDLAIRANAAAEALGMEVAGLRDVQLGGPAYQPRPPFPMMAMAARTMPAPQATAAPQEVRAEVSADYTLREKKDH